MERFKNILVVFDSKTDNRALLDQAVNLGQRNRAALTVVDVIEEVPRVLKPPKSQEFSGNQMRSALRIVEEFPDDSYLSPNVESSGEDRRKDVDTSSLSVNIQESIIQVEERNLQQFTAAIQRAGIQVSSKTIFGIPFIEIIRKVKQSHHDLVMITAEGKRGLKETLFGSTTMHLMRKCPCPVWVIKQSQTRKFRRILAAVDLGQDVDRTALAKKIIELGTSLARLEESELIIVHAWSMYGESILKGRVDYSSEEVERLLRETRDMHRQWLVDLLQQHNLEDLKIEVYLLKGEAGEIISDLARSKEVDLIVMGTVSRAGIAGLLIGNTAETVLHRVDCSMLTLKPEGFISPV